MLLINKFLKSMSKSVINEITNDSVTLSMNKSPHKKLRIKPGVKVLFLEIRNSTRSLGLYHRKSKMG